MAAAREGYKSGYDMPDSLPCDEIGQFKVLSTTQCVIYSVSYRNNHTSWYLFGALCMQESLAQMRAIDDRIIYKLNTSIPTQSFSGQVSAATQCKQLYDEVSRMWSMLDASALRPSKACTYLGVVGLAGVCSTLVHWCKLMTSMWACKESSYSECCVGMPLAPLYCMWITCGSDGIEYHWFILYRG